MFRKVALIKRDKGELDDVKRKSKHKKDNLLKR